MRSLFVATVAAILLPTIFVFAQTATDEIIQQLQGLVESLQEQVTDLEAELSETRGETTETIAVQGVPFERNLGVGMTGDDVSNLQAYLKQFIELYPEGLVTGYFGQLTQRAVQRFQSAYGIVSSGDPATTGYGLVGPMTRAKLNELIGVSSATSLDDGGAQTLTTETAVTNITAVPQTETTTTGTVTAGTSQYATTTEPIIKTGTGSTSPSRSFNIGTGSVYYTVGASSGAGSAETIGYLFGGTMSAPEFYFGDVPFVATSSCPSYTGLQNICTFTEPSAHSFTSLTSLTIRDKDSACYGGLLPFKQGSLYGVLEFTDIDTMSDLHYKYWYDTTGGAHFDTLCTAAAEPAATATTTASSDGTASGTATTTATGTTASSTPTGVCLIRDSYTSVPKYSDSDVGTGYAKIAKAGINTLDDLKTSCTQADYDSLMTQYCATNTNQVQRQVMTYQSSGNYQSLTCDDSGCEFVGCPGQTTGGAGSSGGGTTGTVATTTDSGAATETSTSTATTTPPTADTVAPAISGVTASSITSSGATITWTTNEAADSQIEYGLATSYGSTTALDTSFITSHSVPLSGLSANTTHYYRVKSKDAAGNLATSDQMTFATESSPLSQCGDGVDNDGDGLTDLNDPGCSSSSDDDETNAPTSSTPTGVCLIRDSYTSVPKYADPDIGSGYAKLAKPGVNTITGLKSSCVQSDYNALLEQYCATNSNWVSLQVMTYSSGGTYQQLSGATVASGSLTCESLTAEETPTGVCMLRDSYTSIPIYFASDVGTGYAKLAKPGTNTISALKTSCTQADYDSLMTQYCAVNTNKAQPGVVTYSGGGVYQQSSCPSIGCNYLECPVSSIKISGGALAALSESLKSLSNALEALQKLLLR